MILPGCQDTGTGIVIGKKGQYVWTEGSDEEDLSRGVFKAYTETNLRYSQVRTAGLCAVGCSAALYCCVLLACTAGLYCM